MGALGHLLESGPTLVPPKRPTTDRARVERAHRDSDGQWVWETMEERDIGGLREWDELLREIGQQKSGDTAYRVKWITAGCEVRRSAHFPIWPEGKERE